MAEKKELLMSKMVRNYTLNTSYSFVRLKPRCILKIYPFGRFFFDAANFTLSLRFMIMLKPNEECWNSKLISYLFIISVL
jgi:hypothetical protein